MGTNVITANQVLYDSDFHAWTENTAQLIREGRFGELAIGVLAEEIEDMGKRDYREVKHRLEVLLVHLLKWKYQPTLRSSSGRATIREQRKRLAPLFKDSPRLENKSVRALDEEIYPIAAEEAVEQTGLPAGTFPVSCPFNFQLMLSHDYWPD